MLEILYNVIIIVIVGVVVFFAYFFITLYRIFKKPKNWPAKFLKKNKNSIENKKVFVMIGDSITQGTVGKNYTKMVSKHLNSSQKVVDLINAGLNGDYVLNVLRRLDDIISCKPDFVTIMIGTNDAGVVYAPDGIDAFRKLKKVPLEPEYWTIPKYKKDLTEIISRLKKETNAKIAVFSIPTIGENFDHPVFDLSLEFTRTIKDVASELSITYLPLSERMVEYLKEHPSSEKYPYKEDLKMMLRAIFAHYLFGRSWEKIARKNGCHLHIDHLHLSETGATMVADLIENFYKENK